MRPIQIAVAVAICLASTSPAGARDTFHDIPVERASESELGKEKLLDVPFYMAGQKHPGVAEDLGTYTTNRRTNAFAKSDQEACKVAFLSAVIALQKRAKTEGGDAVIDVRSITRHRDLESATAYRCVAGTFVANVALSGTVVRLGK